ncbi:zinc-dependent metalloprotease [uncultured Alistipes sp.]|uniref:zinc-dependent metalloprotease n=1 Tax=uncultured Alistipes sp. TaxID=538949 RepID=UPI002582D911|nr:zinc-dependent metalloprotease [uncultured Alistipes sp.]
MFKQLLALLLCILVAGTPVQAKSPKRKSKKASTETPAKPKESEYDKLFKKKHEVAEGMVKLHKIDGKLYFEFPQALFGREMLLGSVISETSDNLTGVPGSKSYTPLHITFTKTGENVQIREINADNYTLGIDGNILRSLDRNNIPTIFRNFKIDAYNADSTAVVFNVTDLFVSHVKELSPFSYLGAYGGSGTPSLSETFKKELSSLGDVKSFADNLTVKSTLSYTYSVSHPVTKQKLVDKAPFTAVMTRTLVLLPREAYRPRITDSRMSVFPTGKYLYSSKEQRVKAIYLANRWRVEPSDMEAWKRGEQVTPLQPIVFYIDPDFPAKWQPAIYEAVTQWNEVFAKIGFRDVVKALPYPTDDPAFDADNIKYSCIRYAPVPIANAMGPSWVDPRSGEILNASVYVFHDVVKMLNRMIFVQTAQADARVRQVNIPDEVMLDGLRYVLTHEVGHCLGFMHNMSSSAVIPVDSLRSPSFTQKYGTTTSIMDYARFNYVAQPGDMERGVRLTPPRFGVYDDYAVKWLYTPVPEAKTPEEEYEVTSKWITEASADPTFRYGKQQFGSIVDPKSQTEDLGDDAVAASQYGIRNLRYILANLDEWCADGDDDFSYRNGMYSDIVNQYITYIGHVYANIGGIYLNEKMEGDPVEAYACVPREKQRKALKFILAELKQMEWLDNERLLAKMSMLGSPRDAVREAVIKAAVNAPAKKILAINAQLSKDPYTPEACYKDVSDFVWEPTVRNRRLTGDEMAIQREFVKVVATKAGLKNYTGSGSSASAFAATENAAGNEAEDAGWDALRVFENRTPRTPLCSCETCSHGFAPEPQPASVSGFGSPRFQYFTQKDISMLYYNDILRIQNLLRGKVGSATGETRMHYQYLLHNLDKALKK